MAATANDRLAVPGTLTTLLAGEDQTNNLLTVADKYLVSATYAPSTYSAFGTKTNDNVTSLPAQLKSLDIASIEASTLYYFQIWNGAAAGTGTLLYSWPIAIAADANHPVLLAKDAGYFTRNGVYCSAGISWGISSTNATYTAAGTAARYNVHIQY